MNRNCLATLILVVSSVACNETKHNKLSKDRSVLEIELSNGYNQWMYFEQLSVFNSGETNIDSAFVKDRVEKISFEVREKEEGLYRIYSKDHRVDIIFINSPGKTALKVDYFDNGKFQFINSSANISLHKFLDQVKEKAGQIRQMSADPSSAKRVETEVRNIQYDYRNFVDTVSSPAAAIYVYNAVDFGQDRDSLKIFVNKLEKRFPTHPGIKLLSQDVKSFLSIFEEELNIGDTIPTLSVFNLYGLEESVRPLSAYTLISFWASWDMPSRIHMENLRTASLNYKGKGLSMVSISLDPEIGEWKKFLQSGQYNWKQLIDGKAWNGPSVRAYKFDSIPFNYLVNQNGVILDKALYGEELIKRLDKIK